MQLTYSSFQKGKGRGYVHRSSVAGRRFLCSQVIRDHFKDEATSKVMLCGGHVARAFTKSLGELAKQKSFSPALRDIHRKKFPAVDTVKCHCPKRHSKNCGFFSKSS